jgi:hypothetical protein
MTRVHRIVFTGVVVSLVGLGSTLQLRPGSTPPEKIDVLSDIRGQKVRKLYQTWANAQEVAGGETNLVVALGRARNHTVEARRAAGTTRIDMKSGHITAQVNGLDRQREYDLWLVDNLAKAGESAMPDPGDKMVRVGALQHDGEVATLAGQVDVSLFDHFQADMVVVTRRGEQPDSGGVLFGSLSLFQRVYSALGSPPRLLASDFASSAKRGATSGGPILSVRSAYADNIFIDADILFNGLVRRGADLFINETFNGNGRTCATCHPALNNVTIDVPFIAGLYDDDPLFVAEFVPELAQNFENPKLMRGAALIQENLDGFDDLANKFVMRAVPHVLGMSTSLAPTSIPFDQSAPPNSNFPPGFPAQRTGWGGDGAPNTGSLRDFATGAVTQHFPLTLARVNGQDFRLPDASELDAMEAFQLALGRQEEVAIAALKLRDPRVRLGRELFNRLDTGNPAKPTLGVTPNPAPQGPPLPAGKCALCHFNAGANLNSTAFTQIFASVGNPVPTVTGNANFGTGVNDLAALPADIIDPAHNPRDGGFGRVPHDGTPLPQIGNVPCAGGHGGFGVVTLPGGILPAGLCEEDFNTPSLIEAADTPPFFHNNAVNTIEAAVSFYNDAALNNSVGGQLIRAIDTNGIGIRLDTTQVTAVASFLRVLNALENIRQARETLGGTLLAIFFIEVEDLTTLLDNIQAEIGDAAEVLKGGQLHPVAAMRLQEAFSILSLSTRIFQLSSVSSLLTQARNDLVDP